MLMLGCLGAIGSYAIGTTVGARGLEACLL